MKNLELFEQAIDLQGLTNIEINTDGNDYPRGLGAVGAIGFNQFSEAEAFAEKNGGEVVVFKTRDGHHFWRNEGRAYSPFTAHDYIDGADDNTNLITEEDLTNKFWDDLKAATEDKDIDEVERIFENYKEHLADIQAAGEGKVCFFDGNTNEIGTLDEVFMEYYYDVYSYAIGVWFHPDLHEEGAEDESEESITDVLFLIELPNEDTPCDVFAYFPNEPYNTTPNLKSGYVHLGQHTAIHTEYANECIKATPEQYQDLKRELEQIGYNLNVLN